jgi:hypothetical protein
MNAVPVTGPEELSEGFSVERSRPDIDIGRECVHHGMVHAGDVHPLFSMRHSECAPALAVPLVSHSVLDRIYKMFHD